MIETYPIRVRSASNPNDYHVVTLLHHEDKSAQYDEFLCDCKGFMFNRTTECRHIQAVRRAWWENMTYDIGLLEKLVNAKS